MEQLIRVNSSKTSSTAQEPTPGRISASTLATGTWANAQAMALAPIPMGASTRDVSRIISKRDAASSLSRTEVRTSETGKTTSKMARASSHGLTAINSTENGIRVRVKMALLSSQMAQLGRLIDQSKRSN